MTLKKARGTTCLFQGYATHPRRYEDEKEMYKTCDLVIDLIDCVFWEVYSKDQNFLDKLERKFQETESILDG